MTIRTINNVRNPKWANFQQTLIDVEVDFDELDEEYVPFTAMADDVEPHGVIIYNNAIAGNYGTIAAFDPPENVTGEAAMQDLRVMRNVFLAETDYIEMPTKWATLTTEKQTEWATYRNALRDLPANYPNPELRWNSDYTELTWYNVVWPVKPVQRNYK